MKGEIYLESAVYRVVDTETMQIVYIGFTRYLDVSTIRNVRICSICISHFYLLTLFYYN
ncbi:MAG: hypothetical protein IKI37_10095 [Oscillospiraceae bacterium]|nr:hypothetical protein [Oscillospiraceae bacterium]